MHISMPLTLVIYWLMRSLWEKQRKHWLNHRLVGLTHPRERLQPSEYEHGDNTFSSYRFAECETINWLARDDSKMVTQRRQWKCIVKIVCWWKLFAHFGKDANLDERAVHKCNGNKREWKSIWHNINVIRCAGWKYREQNTSPYEHWTWNENHTQHTNIENTEGFAYLLSMNI